MCIRDSPRPTTHDQQTLPFFVEILASKVGAQVIAQKFVQGKVSVVYSLKLLHLGEFPSQDMQSFWMTFHYDVYIFLFFSVFAFQPKQNVEVARV